jgi:chemosensory pili system protein ChpA (sensor histidine kinase/response regulator)
MLDTTPGSLQPEAPLTDLGPLAWVFDELRKSLDGANKSIRRFVRESDQSRRDDLEAVDPAPLRLARQQLHQAVGALEMVGLAAPAQVLRAMESAVNRFVQKPHTCTEDAASRVEKAGFALVEYLESVLSNKPVHPVALFAQYRDVQELTGAERVHPADLWPFETRGTDVEPPSGGNALQVDTRLRSLMDRLVLLVVKTHSPAAAQQLARLCASLSAMAPTARVTTFWRVAAAYFEAVGLNLLAGDVYAKRAASRILLQFAAFSQGQAQVSETLLHDLLFFCSQADPAGKPTQHLQAVRDAFGLTAFQPIDYAQATLGRYDPALLLQARKRINAAKESWSLFAGGDGSRARQVTDQFGLIADSLLKLLPGSTLLAQALVRAVDQGVRDPQGVRPDLAMEVATTTLYLEAAFEDFDPADPELGDRARALASRLDRMLGGAGAQPLEPWMEQLYRRVSDRQTLGSVVGELKVSLAEAEKSLDQFFRNPVEKAGLHVALNQLSQMRGVLSVLGLDQAVQAVGRMRQVIDQMIDTEVDESQARQAGTFGKLGDNLSALSFLVDMLNYQPALAKKVFVFDEEKGELIPLMGKTQPVSTALETVQQDAQAISEGVQRVVSEVQQGVDLAHLSEQLGQIADQATLAEQPGVARAAREAAQAVVGQDGAAGAQALVELSQAAAEPAPAIGSAVPAADDVQDDDLLDIFLEEANEVVANGRAAVQALRHESAELEHQTTLRRAFHTLKGSSRMVGLSEFGEAAWALEQELNSLLSEQRPAPHGLLDLSADALDAFAAWVSDIGTGNASAWRAQPFRSSAEAWRQEQLVQPVLRPDIPVPALDEAAFTGMQQAESAGVDVTELADTADLTPQDFAEFADTTTMGESGAIAESVDLAIEGEIPMLEDIDFSSLGVASDRTEDAVVPLAEESQPTLDVQELVPAEPEELPSIFDEASSMELALPVDEADQPLPQTGAPDAVSGPGIEEALPVESADLAPVPQVPEDELLPSVEIPEDAVQEEILPSLLQEVEPAFPALEATGPQEEETEAVASTDDGSNADDAVKVVGPLRIGIKLYNVYLNEADEWSRRLCTGLAEWALECHEPVHDQAEALAHSLAGSSATVGFQPLSDIARALEHAIGTVASHQEAGYPATSEQAQLFVDASEDIRRLLHQFAAGFYKEPNADILSALHDVVHAPLPAEAPAPVDEDEQAVSESVVEVAVSSAPVVVEEVAPFESVVREEARTEWGQLSEASAAGVQDIDDDIDVVDTIDVDLFPIFAEEAQELLPQLGGALRQWVARPDNAGARAEVLRALHTLKGSARLAGALRLGEMVHRMETDAERLGSEGLHSTIIEPLLTAYDAILVRFETLRHADTTAPADVIQRAPEGVAPSGVFAVTDDEAGASTAEGTVPVVGVDQPTPVSALTAMPASGLTLPAAPVVTAVRSQAAVRVRPELLDRLVSQTGEVMISRSRMEAELLTLRGSLKDLTGNLDRLRQQLRDMELQAESQMQSRLAQAKDTNQSFDPLEFDRFTRVQELTRMMAESVNDVATVQRNLQRAVESTEDSLVAQARQTRELQRDLLRTRMVEFEGISERLYRVVRQAAKETGKQVRLDIVGGAIEMDRGVLDRMTAAFEHLLRNCIVHGIESPDVRVAAGKPAEGRIEIRLTQELNDVSVVFQDDGAGLDLERLREKAVSQGYVAAGTEVTDEEAAQFIYLPGLSTAGEITSLAGRGVGMDVVRNDVIALGGRLETWTAREQGVRFTLVLPLTTAVTQVVMLRAGDLTLGVPSNLVELVRRVSPQELSTAYANGYLRAGEEDIPFFWAGALLQSSSQSSESRGRTLPVVIFRSAAQRVAIHVDEVLGNQEVVVKNLGPQLSRLPGLAGMSVLASGAVALIYNPVALATVYGSQVREWVTQQLQLPASSAAPSRVEDTPVASAVPLVLVVDDSITVRRVTQRLLQREGYRVLLAADGLQALERLQQERPTVVLSDIEMPRMDGFDLVRNIRNDVRLADLPVIMITSRIAEKHREHARELGVDHYLGKPYSEDELLALIAHYAKAAVEV